VPALSPAEAAELRETARHIRAEIVRMIHAGGSGHPGGSLSAADIVAVLYFHSMNIRPEDPSWPQRDRFILSKGHACPVLYAALAHRGYFDHDTQWSLRAIGSCLQGHPDMRKCAGCDMTSGSLGQGLSVAVGMALGLRLDGNSGRMYVVLGDGEIQEGQVWEAAMAAAHYKLDRITAFVDFNGLQVDGPTAEIMEVRPIPDKWRAFGWHVVEIDGHSVEEIAAAVDEAKRTQGRPTCIVARTIKGKGVSFMENEVDWHGMAISDEQLARALSDLGEAL